jgi:hypothetical protein
MIDRATKLRLRKVLQPGEKILATDLVAVEMTAAEGTEPPKVPDGVGGKMSLAVTAQTIFLARQNVIGFKLAQIISAERSHRVSQDRPPQLTIRLRDGRLFGLTYDRDSVQQITSDLIMQAFSGSGQQDWINESTVAGLEGISEL